MYNIGILRRQTPERVGSRFEGSKHRSVHPVPTQDSTPIPNGFKRCARCKSILPSTLEFFTKDARKKDGLVSACKECERIRVENWRQQYPEKSKQSALDYGTKHRAEKREYAKIYRLAYPEKIQKNNAVWYETNRTKAIADACAHVKKRRTRIRNLVADFTPDQWRKVLEYFNYRCAACDRPEGFGITLSQDHWIPVTKGGAYTQRNIIPLCCGRYGCNNSKGNRDPLEWLICRFDKQKAQQVLKRVEAYFDTLGRES